MKILQKFYQENRAILIFVVVLWCIIVLLYVAFVWFAIAGLSIKLLLFGIVFVPFILILAFLNELLQFLKN
jgi:hypothetical protein